MIRLVLALLAAFVLFANTVDQTAVAAPAHIAQAKLHGGGLKGKVHYELKKKGERFRVKVSNGVPLMTYAVSVNGQIVGTMTINIKGSGKFEMGSGKLMKKKGSNGPPIPDSFPTLGTGDIVTVGPACGIMFTRGKHKTQVFEVQGEAEDANGVDVEVQYREKDKDGVLRRTFKVEIDDAAAAQSFDVLVNGTSVGTIVADDEGEAEFKLDSKLNDMPASACDKSNGDDDGEIAMPMPPTFPSLQPGDVVQVGDILVTLSLASDDDDDDDGCNGGFKGDDDDDDDGNCNGDDDDDDEGDDDDDDD